MSDFDPNTYDMDNMPDTFHPSKAKPQSELPTPPCSPDDQLAARLISALSCEILYKADLFDYLCWLEEKEQRERVPGADFLCLTSDGTTCWGKTYADAVKVAMHHDKGLQDASPHIERIDAAMEGQQHNKKGQA